MERKRKSSPSYKMKRKKGLHKKVSNIAGVGKNGSSLRWRKKKKLTKLKGTPQMKSLFRLNV